MKETPLSAKLGAEALGTFWLVFGGCGAAVLAATFLSGDGDVQLGIGFLGVSLAFGLTVLTGAYAFGHVSGGHFNPAVTIGLAIAKRFDWKCVLPYIVTQIVAATVAGAVLLRDRRTARRLQPRSESGFATNGYGDRSPGGYGLLACLVIEVVLTAVFLYIILGATDDRAPKGFAPIAIGLGLTLIHLVVHPGDQHLGQPGPLARRRLVRRRCRPGPGLAVHRRPDHRCRHRRCHLRGHHRRQPEQGRRRRRPTTRERPCHARALDARVPCPGRGRSHVRARTVSSVVRANGPKARVCGRLVRWAQNSPGRDPRDAERRHVTRIARRRTEEE